MTPLKTLTLRLAMKLQDQYADDYAAYLERCEIDRSHGYRPHYCEHGTNQWTDYDNICGGCEEGETMGDGINRRTRALSEAKNRVATAKRILDALDVLASYQLSRGIHHERLDDTIRNLFCHDDTLVVALYGLDAPF